MKTMISSSRHSVASVKRRMSQKQKAACMRTPGTMGSKGLRLSARLAVMMDSPASPSALRSRLPTLSSVKMTLSVSSSTPPRPTLCVCSTAFSGLVAIRRISPTILSSGPTSSRCTSRAKLPIQNTSSAMTHTMSAMVLRASRTSSARRE